MLPLKRRRAYAGSRSSTRRLPCSATRSSQRVNLASYLGFPPQYGKDPHDRAHRVIAGTGACQTYCAEAAPQGDRRCERAGADALWRLGTQRPMCRLLNSGFGARAIQGEAARGGAAPASATMNLSPPVIGIHGDEVTVEANYLAAGSACRRTGSGQRCGGRSSTAWLSAVSSLRRQLPSRAEVGAAPGVAREGTARTGGYIRRLPRPSRGTDRVVVARMSALPHRHHGGDRPHRAAQDWFALANRSGCWYFQMVSLALIG